MKKRYENKQNHSMFSKAHTKQALALISKAGKLNAMFGRKSELTKTTISRKMNKHLLGIGIYDLNDN